MKIEQNTQVEFSYTISDATGAVLARSEENDHATYIHGYGLILPKLETALAGKSAGETFTVFVPKDEGYGEYEKELVFEVDKSIFHTDNLTVGMEFEDERSGNSVKVLELRDDKVLVDANHPYAGKDLTFEIKVEKVEASKDEDINALQEMLSQRSHGCGCGCHEDSCGCHGADGGCGCGCDGGCC